MSEWAQMISDELCFHLGNYLGVQNTYMDAYLVFAIVYCNVFDSLPIKENVNK
jgi:hypothetical protein